MFPLFFFNFKGDQVMQFKKTEPFPFIYLFAELFNTKTDADTIDSTMKACHFVMNKGF